MKKITLYYLTIEISFQLSWQKIFHLTRNISFHLIWQNIFDLTIEISFWLAAKSSSWLGFGSQASSYLQVLSLVFNKYLNFCWIIAQIKLAVNIHFQFWSATWKRSSRSRHKTRMVTWECLTTSASICSGLKQPYEKMRENKSGLLLKQIFSGWMFLRKLWSASRLGASLRGTPRKASMRGRYSSRWSHLKGGLAVTGPFKHCQDEEEGL